MQGRSRGWSEQTPSVVQSVLQPRETFLEVAHATVAFPLPPPAEREPRGQSQGAHTRDRTDRPLGDPGGCGQASLELAELPVQAVPGGVDLPHRFSCCFAHRTSSFSDSWVSAGLVALERSHPRASTMATAARTANTPAVISMAAHRGRTRSSASAPAIPRKPITKSPSTADAPKTPTAFALVPTISPISCFASSICLLTSVEMSAAIDLRSGPVPLSPLVDIGVTEGPAPGGGIPCEAPPACSNPDGTSIVSSSLCSSTRASSQSARSSACPSTRLDGAHATHADAKAIPAPPPPSNEGTRHGGMGP